MERLLKSYKFYGALFGTISALISGKYFGLDTSVQLAILGLWATVIAGQAVKDAVIENKSN
jgi:hypothetical protein|tara:strand:+ start:421 stop:603 length:183 start_codon:yes stop_codon:yes gene_type:complete